MMTVRISITFWLVWGLASLIPAVSQPLYADTVEQQVMTGERLAAVLRAGRTVISGYQSLINDPSIGDKGLTGGRITEETIAVYTKRVGHAPLEGELSSNDETLVRAQLAAIKEIVDEHQADINRKGVGLKGFIPAVFARLVNERFVEKVGNLARIKATAPINLVRNRRARPDDWERDAIEKILASDDWNVGKTFQEEVTYDGRPALRMLMPEYYSTSCLSCHGGPKGELDITGYPKEGGKENDLGGAISIILFE